MAKEVKTAERKGEFFTTEERRARRQRRAESSGILKKFRGRCDMATPSVRKPFRLPLRGSVGAEGGWFVGGTPRLLEGAVFYNSRAKASRSAQRMAAEPVRKFEIGSKTERTGK